jgi:hypothetical protein
MSDNLDAEETDDSSKIYNDAMLNEHDYLKNDVMMDQLSPPEPEQAIEARNHIKNNFDNILQSHQSPEKVNYYSTDDVDSVTASADTGVLIDDTVDNQNEEEYIDSNCLVKKCVDYSEVIVYSKYNSENVGTVNTATTSTSTVVKPRYQESSKALENVEYSPPQVLTSEVVETSVVQSPVQRIKYNIINSDNIILNSYGGGSSTAHHHHHHIVNNNQSKSKPHHETEPIIIQDANECSGIICNTPSNNEMIDAGLQRLSYNSLIVHDDQDQYINCNDGYLLEEANEDTYCHGEFFKLFISSVSYIQIWLNFR